MTKQKNNEVIIRKARKGDAQGITNLYFELINYNLNFAKYLNNKNNIKKSELKKLLEKRLNKQTKSPFFVAEEGNNLLGFINAEILSTRDSRTKKGVIEVVDIYVHRKRKGIGKMLLDEIAKWAKTKNADYLQWEFMSENKLAENFCSKNKFKPFKTKMIKKLK